MVVTILTQREKELTIKLIMELKQEIKRNYYEIYRQIINIFRDLQRYMIICNDKDKDALLTTLDDYCDDIIMCEQKLSVFKINYRMQDKLVDFFDYLFQKLQELLNTSFKTEENEDKKHSSNEVYLKQKNMIYKIFDSVIMSF